MTKNEIKIREYKAANFKQWLLEEAAAIQQHRQLNKVCNKQEVSILSGNNKDMTISRVLGHSTVMPGSGQWRFNRKLDQKSCWHCGNWVFTLVFWNQQIGIFNANNNINIESREKARVIQKIRQHDENFMGHPDVPMLFSNATNWYGQPFMRLIDYLGKQWQEPPDFNFLATEIAKETFELADFSDLTDEQQLTVSQFIADKELELQCKFQMNMLENITPASIKRFLRYGKPLLINFEKMRDPINTFVLPIFIQPGRTHFFLRTAADELV